MTLIEQLVARGPVLTDGALGTQLQARGLQAGELGDAWNLSHPERVEEVARAYVDAGSGIILTNTFRSNRITLAAHGLAEKTVEMNRAGAAIAKRAAGERARVFASVGSCGKLLMTGEIGAAEVSEAFREQTKALAGAGLDGIVIETMTDLEEAKLALEAALETGLPVAVTMVFDSGKNKDRTMMGATPEQVAKELAAAGAHVIGANCGLGMAGYVPICRRLRQATDRPLWIKPNAGLPELVNGHVTYSTTPEEFAGHVPELAEAGANFIGGCCGTGPEFIRAAREALRTRSV